MMQRQRNVYCVSPRRRPRKTASKKIRTVGRSILKKEYWRRGRRGLQRRERDRRPEVSNRKRHNIARNKGYLAVFLCFFSELNDNKKKMRWTEKIYEKRIWKRIPKLALVKRTLRRKACAFSKEKKIKEKGNALHSFLKTRQLPVTYVKGREQEC